MARKSKNRVEKKNVEYLTEDLMVEIMSRVPVKDLMRFRSVSKSFSSLIDSNSYLARQQFVSPPHSTNSSFVFQNGYTDSNADDKVTILSCWVDLDSLEDQTNDVATKIYNPFHNDHPHDAQVIGSCHGHEKGRFSVLNPTTKNYHLLPAVDDKLVFAGFGYDAVHHSYKVVTMIQSTTSSDDLELMIYDGTWRKVVIPFQGMGALVCPGRVVNGAVYWCTQYEASIVGDDPMAILGFDLAQEEFFHVVTPDFGDALYDYIDMTVFDGRFCLLCEPAGYKRGQERIDIWVVGDGDDGDEWCGLINF